MVTDEPQSRRARLAALLVFVCVTAVGMFFGPSPVTGDETEYYATTYAWATRGSPALTPQVVTAIRTAMPGRSPTEPAMARSLDGSDYALHFWFLSLLATPFFVVCRAIGLDWKHCFVFVNVLAFAGMTAVAYRVLRWTGALILIGGLLVSPFALYLNKAHGEAWSVSLTGIAAMFLLERRWLAAALTLSAVAVQVSAFSPLAVLVLGRWLVDVWRTPRSVGRYPAANTWTRVAACLALLALQPLWTLWKFHTPNLIVSQNYVFPEMATPQRIAAMVLDPDVGFFFGWPMGAMLVAAVLAGGIASPKVLRRYGTFWVLGAVLIAEICYVGAQQANYTTSAPRYWLWFIPFVLVGFIAATRAKPRLGVFAGAFFGLAAAANGYYQYALVDHGQGLRRQPLAELWYRSLPGQWDPPVQVFTDIALGRQTLNPNDLFFRRRIAIDELPNPRLWALSNAGCTKLLVFGYAFTSSRVEPILPFGCTAPVDGRQLLDYVRSTGLWRSEDQYVHIPAGQRESMQVIPGGSPWKAVEDRPPRVETYDVAESGAAAPIFTFRFSDPDGWQDLFTAMVMISTPAAAGRPELSCYVTYNQLRREMAVQREDGSMTPRVVPGRSGELKSRWCTVDALHTWAGELGGSVAVRIPIALDPAIAASEIVVQGGITDRDGHSTGWVRMNRPWREEIAALPDRGASPELTFQPDAGQGTVRLGFEYRDPHARVVNRVHVLLNDVLDAERNACLFEYEPANGVLRLIPGRGQDPRPPTMWLAEGGSLDNGRCRLDGRGAHQEGNRDGMHLQLPLVRHENFAGSKRVWMRYREDDAPLSPWQEIELWRGAGSGDDGGDDAPAVFLHPDAQGDTLHLQFNYTREQLEDVGKMWLLINDTLEEKNACYLTYLPEKGALFLNGSGPNGAPGGILIAEKKALESPQCRVDASDIRIKRNGPKLDLRLRVVRKGAFRGPRRVWAADEKKAAPAGKPKVTPWIEVGTWR